MGNPAENLDFLTDDELQRLTGKVRAKAQRNMLEAMKIPFIARPDNALLVLRSNVMRKLGASERAKPAAQTPHQPRFDKL